MQIKEPTSQKLSIFQFNDFRHYLIAVGLPDGAYSHSSNNLQRWAKRLGYKSASTLSMILKGQRLPSYQLIRAFVEDLKLNSKEKEYFELLVLCEKQKQKNNNPEKTLERLKSLRGNDNKQDIDLEQFKSISRWYFTPIKQLISHPEFIEDEQWIAKKLRFKVTPGQIKHALIVLEELKLIERNSIGQLVASQKGLETSNQIPSAALRMHHNGMIERALESVEGMSIDERAINGLTFCMPEEKLEEAKKDVFNFLKEFNKKYAKQGSGEVYQINIQLFPHSKKVYQQ